MSRESNKLLKRNPKATEAWTVKINKLKAFFEANKFNTPAKMSLGSSAKITNLRNCIDTHLSIIEHNNGIESFRPYLDRLVEIGIFIQNQKKFKKLRESLGSKPDEPLD